MRHWQRLGCLLEVIGQPGEQPPPIGQPERGFHVVLGVRHHPEYVAAVVEDAGDGIGGAVDVPSLIETAVGRVSSRLGLADL